MSGQVSPAAVALAAIGLLAGCGGPSSTSPAPGGGTAPAPAATAKPVSGEITGVLLTQDGHPAHLLPTLFYINPNPGTVRSDTEKARLQHDLDAAQVSAPDASGRFVIRNVFPGKYALFVTISASETQATSAPTFTVTPGQTVDLGTVRARQK